MKNILLAIVIFLCLVCVKAFGGIGGAAGAPPVLIAHYKFNEKSVAVESTSIPTGDGTTYYINTASTGSGDGTTTATSGGNAAWAAISEITGLSAGDSVLLNKGDTWREMLTVPTSGSAGNPITFGAYGTGADPIINGADVVETWSQVGGTNVYSAACDWSATQVFEDDVRLTFVTWDTDIATTDDNMEAGTWTLDTTNDLVYVWASDGLDPDTHTMEVSKRDYCILIASKNYITVDGLTLDKAKQNFRGQSQSSTCDNIVLQNSTIQYAYEQGVLARGFYAGEFGSPGDGCDNWIINANIIHDAGGNGIELSTQIDNFTILNNNIYDNCILSTTGNHDYTAGIKFNLRSTVTNNIIESNTIYSNGVGGVVGQPARGVGIWIDTCGLGNVIRRNLIYSNSVWGIKIERQSFIEVYYNIVHSTTYPNSDWGNGAGIHLVGDSGGATNSNHVYNNVVYGNFWGINVVGDNTTPDCISNNSIKNNIATGNSTESELGAWGGGQNDGTYGSGNVYTYNCFGAEAVGFLYWAGAKNTYDAWETAYGSSTQSVEADPLFIDAANDNFRLRPSSLCINVGVDVGLTRDYGRNPIWGTPDIGAHEIFVHDSSGNNHRGSAYRDLADIETTGKIRGAFDFDGSGLKDYIEIADHVDFSPGDGTEGSGTPFSISAWVYMHSATSFPIVSKYETGKREWAFTFMMSDKVYWRKYDESANAERGVYYDTALTSYQDTWIHLVATDDGGTLSSGLKIYLNGIRVDDEISETGSFVAVENDLGHDVWIGKRFTDNYADGLIDNVMFFSVELSPDDVKRLYNNRNGTEILQEIDSVIIPRRSNTSPLALRKRYEN